MTCYVFGLLRTFSRTLVGSKISRFCWAGFCRNK